jgi:hypothetical protein
MKIRLGTFYIKKGRKNRLIFLTGKDKRILCFFIYQIFISITDIEICFI